MTTTTSASADASRLSFAKVAASAGKDNVASNSFAQAAVAMPLKPPRKENIQSQSSNAVSDSKGTAVAAADNTITNHTSVPLAVQKVDSNLDAAAVIAPEATASEVNLAEAVKALSINPSTPSLVVNGSGSIDIRHKPYNVDVTSEDLFQRADSGSELGTKPPSLDGKSITSGTTFALDEKESLRPDDSASVQAAEDDDAFSGRGSIVAGSRIGSEAAARGYRSQGYDLPEKRNMPPMQERQGQGTSVPQGISSGQQIIDDGKLNKPLVGSAGAPDAFNLFYRQTPDEKLLEALESPKDRIFLLRLEQDVIEFVKDSKEPFIDLPPCNSFCRMLTHKLADYYHMTHQVDAVAGAIRIFRTPFCRLPPSLTTISNPPTTGNTPPPTVPAMKIMRRGGDGDTGPSASKATSETGSDGKDKSLSAKEKLSREEREAAYNRARERIFGKDEKSGEATPDTEDGNEMSRSSSVSTKDRTGQSKRAKPVKQRRDDSDSFDVRSQYTPIFSQHTVPVPTWAPTPQFAMGAPQHFNAPMPNNYQNQMPVPFPTQSQQFNPPMMNTGQMQGYVSMPQQYAQPNQRFPGPHSAPITTYGSPVQSPPMPPQQWQQQQAYQISYQPKSPMMRAPPNSIPYAFGQLPSTVNPADPKSQHPIPGSFNRHAFNPKTQSFVPGNNGLPGPQMSHQGSPHRGSPHHGSPHLTYNAFPPPQQQYANGMGYTMARQGSNNSLPSYHASPHMAHRPMMHQNVSHGVQQGGPQSIGHGMGLQNMQTLPQNGQIGNHLPNYGNPSTLPPKPPTGV